MSEGFRLSSIWIFLSGRFVHCVKKALILHFISLGVRTRGMPIITRQLRRKQPIWKRKAGLSTMDRFPIERCRAGCKDQKRIIMSPTHNLRWYFVYFLRSQKNSSIYIGCTNDLKKRIREHNHSMSYHTKKYAPCELLYFEGFRDKKDAFMREKSLKLHAQGLRRLKERLRGTFA